MLYIRKLKLVVHAMALEGKRELRGFVTKTDPRSSQLRIMVSEVRE